MVDTPDIHQNDGTRFHLLQLPVKNKCTQYLKFSSPEVNTERKDSNNDVEMVYASDRHSRLDRHWD